MLSAVPRDYAAARSAFLQSCDSLGLVVEQHECPVSGPAGELLAIDVARLGARNATKALFVISGTHGLEGLAGSSCQVEWLAGSRPTTLPSDQAVVLIHLLNPWGCAWRRRQTEGNVDLNRNFLDYTEALPANPGYDQFREAVSSADFDGPGLATAWAAVARYRAEYGERAYATALFQGQYDDAAGIGFGGREPAWSNLKLREILRTHGDQARTVAVIDIHTGLGAYGRGMLIATSAAGSRGLELARQWYGANLAAVRAQAAELPYEVRGDLCGAIEQVLTRATVVPVALEFGTHEMERLLSLQIDDWWLANHGDLTTPRGQAIRAALQDFFCPPDPVWQGEVWARFDEVMTQAMAGLASC